MQVLKRFSYIIRISDSYWNCYRNSYITSIGIPIGIPVSKSGLFQTALNWFYTFNQNV